MKLDFADLDTPLITAFLQHLETGRGNSVATRNARLAAIHSLFGYAALQVPEHAGLIARVLAIPPKRSVRTEVSFLSADETSALLSAPDRTTWTGRRDHTLLLVMAQTGLRIAETIALRGCDVELGTGAHVRCTGKGRKNRSTPLTTVTVNVLRAWLAERGGAVTDPVFPPAAAVRSAQTRSSSSSPSTLPSPPRHARPCRASTSHPTHCGIQRPWRSCTAGSICP